VAEFPKINSFNTRLVPIPKGCDLCSKKNHPVRICPRFLQMTVDDRLAYIQKKQLCSNCFASSHQLRDCTSAHNCLTCQDRHHTLLHRLKQFLFPSVQINIYARRVKTPKYPRVFCVPFDLGASTIFNGQATPPQQRRTTTIRRERRVEAVFDEIWSKEVVLVWKAKRRDDGLNYTHIVTLAGDFISENSLIYSEFHKWFHVGCVTSRRQAIRQMSIRNT